MCDFQDDLLVIVQVLHLCHGCRWGGRLSWLLGRVPFLLDTPEALKVFGLALCPCDVRENIVPHLGREMATDVGTRRTTKSLLDLLHPGFPVHKMGTMTILSYRGVPRLKSSNVSTVVESATRM